MQKKPHRSETPTFAFAERGSLAHSPHLHESLNAAALKGEDSLMGNLIGAGGQAAIKGKRGQKGKLLRKKNKEELQLVIAEIKTHPLVCRNGI